MSLIKNKDGNNFYPIKSNLKRLLPKGFEIAEAVRELKGNLDTIAIDLEYL